MEEYIYLVSHLNCLKKTLYTHGMSPNSPGCLYTCSSYINSDTTVLECTEELFKRP